MAGLPSQPEGSEADPVALRRSLPRVRGIAIRQRRLWGSDEPRHPIGRRSFFLLWDQTPPAIPTARSAEAATISSDAPGTGGTSALAGTVTSLSGAHAQRRERTSP